MTLTDTIRRELWHAYNWRETIERTGALCTAEQVVESGVAEIEKAIAAEHQPRLTDIFPIRIDPTLPDGTMAFEQPDGTRVLVKEADHE